MNENERDAGILESMLLYCGQIQEAADVFGDDRERFCQSSVYQNAVCMCLLQIGELAGVLSDGFRAAHDEIPWRKVKALRNILAHRYGAVDAETAWEIVKNDLPALRAFCESILSPGSPAV